MRTFLFGSGAPPPLPFPGCGQDQTGDPLGCAQYAFCAPEILENVPDPNKMTEQELASTTGIAGAKNRTVREPSELVELFSGELFCDAVDLLVVDPGSPAQKNLDYDYRSQLGAFDSPGDDATYAYDAPGRRIER